MSFKEKVRSTLLFMLANDIARLQLGLSDLRASAANETKSSAGDKYETGRAMLQAEQDQISKQLQDLLQRRAVVESLPTALSDRIGPGSLVKTDNGFFYISAAAGKIIVDGKAVVSISASSPLAQKLIGLEKEAYVEMNNVKYVIGEIY